MRLLTTMHVNPTYQHALTRVVGGGREDEEPERFSLELLPGDSLLLLSDGLWRVLDEKEVLHTVLSRPVHKAVEELLSLALVRNSPDNVTAVLARWRGPGKAKQRVEVEPVEASLVVSDRISIPGHRAWSRIWPFLLLIVGIVLAAVALFGL
jgi:serine/threonine protein phosphatase PrpC